MLNMNRFRCSNVAVGLVVVCGTITVARPGALARAGLDFWSLPALNQELQAVEADNQELDAAATAVLRRIRTKDEIVNELIHGETDLLHAAVQFRNLNAVHADYMGVLRHQFPGRTDEECVCRNVIAYTAVVVANRSDRAEILERLEAEYARYRQSQIHLPA
jgi:hypothetical protein